MKLGSKRHGFAAWGVAALLLGGCGGEAPSADGDGLRIVATTGIIADMAARVAGDSAVVTALMGPGVDPHLYKASEGDVRRLANADLILYNGLHLEGKMGDILGKMSRTRPVVAVTEAVPEEMLREPPEMKGQHDPHLWFDIGLWAKTIDPVAEELCRIDPEHAAGYRRNAGELVAELKALDAWVESRIATIPEEHRVLVTAHDAFGYFGQRYGVHVVGLQGISTLSEAGLKDVDRVVDTVVDRRIKAVFVESSVPRQSIEAVQSACAARGHEVAIGGELYSDSMGAAGTEEGTYMGMVRHNVNTIVEALQ